MTRWPAGITVLADAFGVRLVPCFLAGQTLYAECIGPVSVSVPVVVRSAVGLSAAREVRQRLRAAGYERVEVEEQ